MMDAKSGDRQERRRVIGKILRRSVIHSRPGLVARLAEQGFSVTQSSVWRDLQRVGASRVNGRYHTFDALMSGGAHACKLEQEMRLLLAPASGGVEPEVEFVPHSGPFVL